MTAQALREHLGPITIFAEVAIAASSETFSDQIDVVDTDGDFAFQIAVTGSASAVCDIDLVQSMDGTNYPKEVAIVTDWTPASGTSGQSFVNLTDKGAKTVKVKLTEKGGVNGAVVSVKMMAV